MPIVLDGTAGIDNDATDLSYTGTLTGGTGVVNLGSGQLVKDSSGNLGLGVTPSASTLATFESEYGLISGKDEVNIIQSAYYGSGGFRYSKTEAAARYLMNSGIHSWYTAPTGTAGNAISFTQAMTLDASGNLGVGTTTTSGARLTVMGANGGIILDDSNGRKLKFDPPGSINSNVAFIGTTTPHALRINSGTATNEGTLIFSTENTERARIDSSGNFIQSVPSTAPSLDTNSQMVFNLTSNTNLRVSVRGSDGVTRTANITLA